MSYMHFYRNTHDRNNMDILLEWQEVQFSFLKLRSPELKNKQKLNLLTCQARQYTAVKNSLTSLQRGKIQEF